MIQAKQESLEKKEEAKDSHFFNSIKITLASPDNILSWSHGEVTKPETINYRTFKPEKDGLFDERIFGPTKDYECYCGKYKRMRYKGIICDRCGVEVTSNTVRRERMGHIKLASPVAHIWYFKGVSSPISILLGISSSYLERIIYFALYLVTSLDESKRKETLEILKKENDKEKELLQNEYDLEIKATEEELEKSKDDMKASIKNQERLDLSIKEIEFKYRNKLVRITQKFNEKKDSKDALYSRIIKIVENLKKYETIEEEDYMFLTERNAQDFISVGMGSEVIFEVLSKLNLKEMYANISNELLRVKGERRVKLIKKMRLIESFINSDINPTWMILQVLPIIPPDLRPVVQLSGGKFATSDLNDFYRRVINRNNRLKHLIELGAPDIILRNEKRMLQEAVDSLIDLQKTRGKDKNRRSTSSKALKSLSDVLRGKQGRFRQNLLGKRVDYSGRSVIIVGPDLSLDQCGLPKEMALELFKPFLLREVLLRGLAQNIKSARTYLERKDPEVYDILEEITKKHPVMLNRPPTLHKLSILAFYPVLTDDYGIRLHPAVCQGFNADFDGDQMGVFVPLSKRVIDEIKCNMFAYNNLLKPSDGTPIVLPNKEMALGCYYITSFNFQYSSRKGEDCSYYSNEDEALAAYEWKKIKTREPIFVQINGTIIKTSIGRIIFNRHLPEELRWINKEIRQADIKEIVSKAIKLYAGENKKVAKLIDSLKNVGFWGATIAGGISVSVFDCEIIPEKQKMIDEAELKIKTIEKNYEKGLISDEEKRRSSNNVWIDTTENMADKTWKAIDEENPVKLIIKSGGARASREQLKQLSAMKGLVIDPMGKIIEVPTTSNYREGLSIFEYVINTRGARKGLTDSALKTADAGYLTRRLVDVSHDVIVREEDCHTQEGLTIYHSEERGNRLLDRIRGRYLLEDLRDENGKVLLKKGELVTDESIHTLQDKKILSAKVRSPFRCKTKHGVCVSCYGIDLSTGNLVSIGTPVGVIAAQSIGEPGTQLTMRVRHFGGIVIADVTQGLPRVEELFEARTPKSVSPISDIDGIASIQEDTEKEVFTIKITSLDKENAQERDFIIPNDKKLKIQDGAHVKIGQALSEGYLDIKDILAIRGLQDAQMYLLNEIQKVYESQGIIIHDKHFEVIIRKMSDKVVIEQEGDTSFIAGEVVSEYAFEEENNKALVKGGSPAVGRVAILGVTRAAMYSDSWLSSSSFQGTTTALMTASIKGQVDHLLGLKENVIIGRPIPVTPELLKAYYSDETQEELPNSN